MVVPLIIGAVLTGVSTLFVADLVGTLLHWSVVGASLVAAAGLFYNLDLLNPLDLSEVTGVVSYGFVAGLAGWVLFRLLSALVAAVSGAVFLLVLLLVVGLFLNPVLVIRLIFGLFEVVKEIAGDN